MIQREAELQKYLSTKQESIRNHELSQKIEASLEELLERNGSPMKDVLSASEHSSSNYNIKTHQS